MFDTHCHLNFSRFKKNVDEVIQNAHAVGVTHIVIPGTDAESSKKGIGIAEKYDNIYAAIGIHPHHVFEINQSENRYDDMYHRSELEKLINHPKVVAVGEIGLDYHVYKETKYESYNVTDDFKNVQKELFEMQFRLGVTNQKSIILHNREAVEDILKLVSMNWDTQLEYRMVFHCCEPKKEILEFCRNHHIFMGVDGDITYEKAKQEFIKEIPLDMLVVETDSPFLLPEPMRSRKEFPNEPKHIPFIISFIADILGKSEGELQKITTENSKRLFSLL